MVWVILSLLVAILWSITSLINKHVLDKYIREPLIFVITSGFIGLITGILIFIKEFVILPLFPLVLSLVTGSIYTLIAAGYFKALKIEEASRISPLASLSVVFILIFSYLFLGEVLTLTEYLGVFLLVSGAFLISLRRNFKLRNSRAFWLMVLTTMLAALYSTSTKYLLNFANYWTIFAYLSIGYFISTIPLIYICLPELRKAFRIYSKHVWGLMILSRIINVFGLLSFTAAVSFSPQVSLVVGIHHTEPLFVLFFALILSFFYPQILKEETKGSVILLKVIATIIIIIGALLVI